MTASLLPSGWRTPAEAARDMRAKADRLERHGDLRGAAILRDWAARILTATLPRQIRL